MLTNVNTRNPVNKSVSANLHNVPWWNFSNRSCCGENHWVLYFCTVQMQLRCTCWAAVMFSCLRSKPLRKISTPGSLARLFKEVGFTSQYCATQMNCIASLLLLLEGCSFEKKTPKHCRHYNFLSLFVRCKRSYCDDQQLVPADRALKKPRY